MVLWTLGSICLWSCVKGGGARGGRCDVDPMVKEREVDAVSVYLESGVEKNDFRRLWLGREATGR